MITMYTAKRAMRIVFLRSAKIFGYFKVEFIFRNAGMGSFLTNH